MATQAPPLPFHQLTEGYNGVALIITNDYRGSSMKPLTETHTDGEKMARVLKELNYVTSLWRNVTCTKMQWLLREASQMKCPKSYCSIVIVFSGHGTADKDNKVYIITQDSVNFPVRDFVDPFMPKNSEAIATTHKVFLIDACLGQRDAYRFAVTVPVPKGGEPVPRPAIHEVENKGGRPVVTIDLPEEGNYILAYSTSIGDQSYEIMNQGGMWLNALSQKIWDKGRTESVVNILSEVTGDLITMYQDSAYKKAMTQPHYITKSHGTVCLVPEARTGVQTVAGSTQGTTLPLAGTQSQQGGHGHEAQSQTPTLNSKGQYRSQLNSKEQTKKISKLQYIDLPITKNGLFQAEVTFELTATGEPFAFRSSAERGTLKEAREEAAKVACRHLDAQVRQVPKSAVKRQSSDKSSAPVKRQSSVGDRNPLQRLKECCEAQKPNFTYELQGVPTSQHQQFQFKVTVRDGAGRILCEETGAIESSKQAAKHNAANRANVKLGF